ncbi:MAG: serine O-acetyltransferase [Proteobacteria bacterium]|jgi:serine O-acetyltransferase|nr:serine O-acetyltransferase [Pseudomonadota bacterium]
MFELIREDWQTYQRDPWRQGLWVMMVYRFGRWRYGIKNRLLRKICSIIYKWLKILCQILTGIDLPCETEIGRRLRIDHFGGVIISGDTIIGDDVVLRHGVTLGLKNEGERGAPRLGHRVEVGAGAKILGKINIGNDAKIGANAVVLMDVPAGAIAVGIPARIIRKKHSN